MTFRHASRLMLVGLLLSGTAVHALQDPTRPPGAAPESQTVAPRILHVSTIVLGQDRRVAVINGVPLREGESHDGIKVLRIDKDKVDVVDRGQQRVLYPESLPQVRRTQ